MGGAPRLCLAVIAALAVAGVGGGAAEGVQGRIAVELSDEHHWPRLDDGGGLTAWVTAGGALRGRVWVEEAPGRKLELSAGQGAARLVVTVCAGGGEPCDDGGPGKLGSWTMGLGEGSLWSLDESGCSVPWPARPGAGERGGRAFETGLVAAFRVDGLQPHMHIPDATVTLEKLPCPPGTAYDDAALGCAACPPGSYVAVPDQTPCRRCPNSGNCDGSSVAGEREGERWEVALDPRDAAASRARIAGCPAGTVMVRDDKFPELDRCQGCPYATTSLEAVSYPSERLIVAEGESLVGPGLCLPCSEALRCTPSGGSLVTAGYWRGGDMLCPPEACTDDGVASCNWGLCVAAADAAAANASGGAAGPCAGEGSACRLRSLVMRCERGVCLEGSRCTGNHTGPMCGLCDEGGFRTLFQAHCHFCSGGVSAQSWRAIAGIIVAMVFLWAAIFVLPLVARSEGAFSGWRKQRAVSFCLCWVSEYVRRARKAGLAEYFKLLITFVQISGSFVLVYDLPYPRVVLSFLQTAETVAFAEITSTVSLQCTFGELSHLGTLILYTAGLACVVALIFLPVAWCVTMGAVFRGGCSAHPRFERTLQRSYFALILLTFASYPIVSNKLLGTFDCYYELGLLKSNLKEGCPSLHKGSATFVYAVVFSIVCVFGVPVFLLATMIFYHVPKMAHNLEERQMLAAMIAAYIKKHGSIHSEKLLRTVGEESEEGFDGRVQSLFRKLDRSRRRQISVRRMVSGMQKLGLLSEELGTMILFSEEEDAEPDMPPQFIDVALFKATVAGMIGAHSMFTGHEHIEDLSTKQLRALSTWRWHQSVFQKKGLEHKRVVLDNLSTGWKKESFTLPRQDSDDALLKPLTRLKPNPHNKLLAASFDHIFRTESSSASGNHTPKDSSLASTTFDTPSPGVQRSPVSVDSVGESEDAPHGAGLQCDPHGALADIVRAAPNPEAGKSVSIDSVTSAASECHDGVTDDVLRVYILRKARELTRDKTITIPTLVWGMLGTAAEETALDRVGALFSKYKVQYWAFDVYEMTRKLFFTSLLVFIMPDTTVQQAVGLTLLIISLVVAVHLRPFAKDWLNVMLIYSSFVQIMTLFYGIMLSSEAYASNRPLTNNAATPLIILALNVSVPLFPLYWIVFNSYATRRVVYRMWDQLHVYIAYQDHHTPLEKAAGFEQKGGKAEFATYAKTLSGNIQGNNSLSPWKALTETSNPSSVSPVRSLSSRQDPRPASLPASLAPASLTSRFKTASPATSGSGNVKGNKSLSPLHALSEVSVDSVHTPSGSALSSPLRSLTSAHSSRPASLPASLVPANAAARRFSKARDEEHREGRASLKSESPRGHSGSIDAHGYDGGSARGARDGPQSARTPERRPSIDAQGSDAREWTHGAREGTLGDMVSERRPSNPASVGTARSWNQDLDPDDQSQYENNDTGKYDVKWILGSRRGSKSSNAECDAQGQPPIGIDEQDFVRLLNAESHAAPASPRVFLPDSGQADDLRHQQWVEQAARDGEEVA